MAERNGASKHGVDIRALLAKSDKGLCFTDHECDLLDEAGFSKPANRSRAARKRDAGPPSAEGWPPPLPLAAVPGVEAFPTEVLPCSLSAFVLEAAEALSCPPDYIVVPMLTIAGAAIGTSRALEVKPGYSERACLYTAIIGPPGSAKTPALKLAAAPIYAEQGRLVREYRAAKEAHDEADDGERGKPPRPRATYVSDITTEKLAEVLEENPRGVVLIRDELAAWLAGMDQYRPRGRGNDRQFYLAAWGGEPVQRHRVSQEDGQLWLYHPFVSVVGCLPPALLSRLGGEEQSSDGFMDRLLFCYPEPTPAVGETWRAVAAEHVRAWAETLRQLRVLEGETDKDGVGRPRFVPLTASGRKVWQKFTDEQAAIVNADAFPEVLRGPWSEMKGYCARLALLLHYVRMAADEVTA
jgi:hypothetical protein